MWHYFIRLVNWSYVANFFRQSLPKNSQLFLSPQKGLPYDSSSTEVLLKSIEKKVITFPPYVSQEAQDLIKKLLVITPSKRPTLQQIKEHKWLSPELKTLNPLLPTADQTQSSVNITQSQINNSIDSHVEQKEQSNDGNSIPQRKLM